MAELPALAEGAFAPATALPPPLGGSMVTGEVTGLDKTFLRLALRNGQAVVVDFRTAAANHLVPPLYMGEFIQVQGNLTGAGTMTAAAVARAKSAPATWSPDIQ